MNELIQKLVAEAGLTESQAAQSLEVVKRFVKDKFPMLGDMVDNVMGAAPQTPSLPGEPHPWLNKISEIIPGEVGEKLEDFAKKAADVAGEGIEKAKEKFLDLEKKI